MLECDKCNAFTVFYACISILPLQVHRNTLTLTSPHQRDSTRKHNMNILHPCNISPPPRPTPSLRYTMQHQSYHHAITTFSSHHHHSTGILQHQFTTTAPESLKTRSHRQCSNLKLSSPQLHALLTQHHTTHRHHHQHLSTTRTHQCKHTIKQP